MTKETIRERVWDDLEESGVARFPFPPHGRIPNYAGATEAADRLADRSAWRTAETIKANPDAPQLPVRRRALRDGKRLYVAVPRLSDERCFLELDPTEVEDVDAATTVSGISEHGRPVAPDEVAPIDLIVSGSVAVSADGARVGKGEGYSDLEFALLAERGLVGDGTTVATTVHERQVVDGIDDADHDVRIDLVGTPERVIRTEADDRPTGIDWDLLDDDRLEEIPALSSLRD
ncbi:5-formyltetrahydrofolate cyclo-ligase [Halovivax sp.]|uniref:5-formyltetrahydrofolate cyclo-ligase n=1 Tax=Halovivax sp. TaxID=1935978 RepID=UPI0025C2F5CC|nr:5-formyltetrahydrofolate cyclo-ligase [Halovivax sp.]